MLRAAAIWTATGLLATVPVAIATASPLLAWRQPVYIAGGFAGILGLVQLLFQPMLAAGYLPLGPRPARQLHRIAGCLLVATVLLHVSGLWLTSPPDVIDALLFRSPTPFSVWGVTAMWLILAMAVTAVARRRLRLRPVLWRRLHTGLAVIAVAGTVAHALLIEGAMGPVSKAVLCAGALAATIAAAASRWRSGQAIQRSRNP